MNEIQRKKRNFRATKKWKDFQKKMKVKQKGIDPITNKKLLKGANLHHKDLDENHYEDLSNENNFVYLNKQTHDFVHWLYRYFVKDEEILERIKLIMVEMKQLNNISLLQDL